MPDVFSVTEPQDIGAVILAAGYSRRMGAFKPLLPLGSGTVIEQVIGSFQQAGINRLWVVTGFRGSEIEVHLSGRPVCCVRNTQIAQDMFVSLQTGLRAMERSLKGFFVMPVDMPLVQPRTITLLRDVFCKQKAAVFYPVRRNRRGHPPLLAMDLAEPLLAWQGDGGLRAFLRQFQDQAADIPVDDEGILFDLDTQNDYVQAMGR